MTVKKKQLKTKLIIILRTENLRNIKMVNWVGTKETNKAYEEA